MNWIKTKDKMPLKFTNVIGLIETIDTVLDIATFYIDRSGKWWISDYFGIEATDLIPFAWAEIDFPEGEELEKLKE